VAVVVRPLLDWEEAGGARDVVTVAPPNQVGRLRHWVQSHSRGAKPSGKQRIDQLAARRSGAAQPHPRQTDAVATPHHRKPRPRQISLPARPPAAGAPPGDGGKPSEAFEFDRVYRADCPAASQQLHDEMVLTGGPWGGWGGGVWRWGGGVWVAPLGGWEVGGGRWGDGAQRWVGWGWLGLGVGDWGLGGIAKAQGLKLPAALESRLRFCLSLPLSAAALHGGLQRHHPGVRPDRQRQGEGGRAPPLAPPVPPAGSIPRRRRPTAFGQRQR
jgi:hypothetical protein